MSSSSNRAYESLTEFAPDWLTFPGETVADLLEERGWTQTEFASRTGFSTKHINQLLKGKASISEDTALKLERVLGSTAKFWMSLENQYREQVARNEANESLGSEKSWLKELPLADMVKFKWVRKFSDKAAQVSECLSYFGVASVNAWRNQYEQPVAVYRASAELKRHPASVAAWLRSGEKFAEEMRCGQYSSELFESALNDARELTIEKDPNIFIPRLIDICSAAGVSVVLEPAPKGCPVSGATKWLSPNKALIMLSLRGKTDDKLWFTFFHEAGHLIKHGKKLIFLDILGRDGLDPNEEEEANSFARDLLISPGEYLEFCESSIFTDKTIRAFANKIGVAPGIILGRLQFDGQIRWNQLNHLKRSYTWDHDD
jgi:HTH-type transcriptional regulator / antitoxin HigA